MGIVASAKLLWCLGILVFRTVVWLVRIILSDLRLDQDDTLFDASFEICILFELLTRRLPGAFRTNLEPKFKVYIITQPFSPSFVILLSIRPHLLEQLGQRTLTITEY